MIDLHEYNVANAEDCRNAKKTEVDEDCIFYLAHRVNFGGSEWIRHDVVLADDFAALRNGVAKVQASIDRRGPAEHCLVYLGNIASRRPEIFEAACCQEICLEVQGLRASNSGDYAVFGIVGDDQMILLSVSGNDAVDAAMEANLEVNRTYGAVSFVPLEISLCDSSINYTEIEMGFARTRLQMVENGGVLAG